MDFFERQAQAQRRTKWLLVYFLLAVICMIAALQVVFALIFDVSFRDLELLGYVAGGVVAVVAIGSIAKIVELSQGGRVVAAMLGGEPLGYNSTDPDEQRLLNVVEEMAIASGVPVPEIYVLPDRSINAFAAGHGPGDTAIGVTRGCMKNLTRDELQGVIAHEFSHILHGDMRLNLRLIGLLNGILCIALLGGILLRSTFFVSDDSDSRDSRSGRGGIAFVLLAAGLALYLVGWIGVFFGNLIKAAVSRQREFLADASAVQYTRNPSGIAGALWKIGKSASRLSSLRAEEASHLFFGNGLADPWFSWFATHPPIDERIAAVDPRFDPASVREVPKPPPAPTDGQAADGFIRPQSLARAQMLLAALPGFAGQAVHDLQGSVAFVYATLLDEHDDRRQAQLTAVNLDEAMRAEVLRLFARRGEIPVEERLPMTDLVMPTLRHLSPDQYQTFKENIRRLVESDREINLFEFALQKTLMRHLDLFFTRATGAKVRYRSVVQLLPEVTVLLSGLAWVGQATAEERDRAFQAGVTELLINTSSHPLARIDGCDLAAIDQALDRMAEAAPGVKRTVLTACREAVAHDGRVELAELELLRVIASVMDCPMPPLPTGDSPA